MSLVCSSIAMPISIFNIIMCAQNEFDPIILEIEMKKRRDKASFKETELQKKKDILKNKLQQTGQKSNMAQQMALLGTGPKAKAPRMSTFYDKENFAREKKAIENRSLQVHNPVNGQKDIGIGKGIELAKKKIEPQVSHDDIDFEYMEDATIEAETARR